MPRELLFSITRKDLDITWYSSKGPGGQKKNKTKNSCRIRHPESGALVTASERRERTANLKAALHRLVKSPKFKVWHAMRCWEVENKKTIEQMVDESMTSDSLKIEVKEDGKWVEKKPGNH